MAKCQSFNQNNDTDKIKQIIKKIEGLTRDEIWFLEVSKQKDTELEILPKRFPKKAHGVPPPQNYSLLGPFTLSEIKTHSSNLLSQKTVPEKSAYIENLQNSKDILKWTSDNEFFQNVCFSD